MLLRRPAGMSHHGGLSDVPTSKLRVAALCCMPYCYRTFRAANLFKGSTRQKNARAAR